MTQTAFVESLVDRFDIQFETETLASVEYGLGPTRMDGNEGDWSYKQAVGGLLWTSAMTRSGIPSTAQEVARHTHNPAGRHWKTVRKIHAYLKAFKNPGAVFRAGGALKPSLFADANTPTDISKERRFRVLWSCRETWL